MPRGNISMAVKVIAKGGRESLCWIVIERIIVRTMMRFALKQKAKLAMVRENDCKSDLGLRAEVILIFARIFENVQ